MNDITALTRELSVINDRLIILRNQKSVIQAKLDTDRSLNFIKEHKIIRADIDFSCQNDDFTLWHISAYVNWLKKNSTKKWCSWNERIYLTTDIIKGKMDFNASARLSDLGAYDDKTI